MSKIAPKSAAITCSILLLFDFILITLYLNGYQLVVFMTTGFIYPLLFNILLLVLLAIIVRRYKWIYIGCSIIAFICLAGALLLQIFNDSGYHTVSSPEKKTALYIESHTAALGETHYFYTFYKKEPLLWGIFMKKLNKSDLSFISQERGNPPSAELALGLDQPVWTSNDLVVFHTINGDWPITLN